MPPPILLTIEETANVLRISKSNVYSLTREYRASGGKSGIPCVVVGGVLRVPRAKLEEMFGIEIRYIPPASTPANRRRKTAAGRALIQG